MIYLLFSSTAAAGPQVSVSNNNSNNNRRLYAAAKRARWITSTGAWRSDLFEWPMLLHKWLNWKIAVNLKFGLFYNCGGHISIFAIDGCVIFRRKVCANVADESVHLQFRAQHRIRGGSVGMCLPWIGLNYWLGLSWQFDPAAAVKIDAGSDGDWRW